ncbi:hypothetical protein [Lysobacter sp. Root494]|uniref:hypothetical protein n=1 Tax=Lysobacter sp. Root494 TaxID=1736549 RepID=UPI000AF04D7A|nr:hypothetical protein [Lysobacter sp. Root494]
MHYGWKLGLVVAMVSLNATSCQAGDSKRIQSLATTTTNHASFRDLAQKVGVQCRDSDKGEGCVAQDDEDPNAADYFDVELHPDCDESGLYGGVVAAEGADLANRLPPKDTKISATLSKGQFVCIRAIARIGQSISRYYVTAVPVSAVVVGCRNNALCRVYGDRSIRFAAQPVAPCRLDSSVLSGDCASGWTSEENLEEFSLGLHGEDGE